MAVESSQNSNPSPLRILIMSSGFDVGALACSQQVIEHGEDNLQLDNNP